MAGEAGFGVNFDAEFLKKLDEADKRLQKIADTSDKVLSVMKDLSKNGIGSVVKGLTQLDTRLKSMSKNGGVGSIGTQAAQSVDAINKMVEALARLTTIQQTRLQTQQAKLDYKTEANNIKELTIAERERARALERQDKANEAANKTKLAALTKEQTNNELELLNAQKRRERELIANDRKHLAAYKQEALEIKRVADEVDRLAKAYRNMPKKINQRDLNKLFTQSSNAKTINQHVTAIHNLKSAINDLDTTHAKYKENLKKIKSEISRNEKELRKLGVTTEKAHKQYKKLWDVTGQLERKVALLFSVSAIKGYVGQLVKVRGEFELQQRSLQSLLRNRDQANEIWDKTVALAVKSPFRVKELVTYTKQLAAYRIESDKLYETNKMLADVSAGLGVDMNRLILAYGQVKAANYLRGTELRQFSEAGVNMLGELAKYFSEIEGRAVSVGDVFERVSKRMVTFQDVNEIFKRITSEGGVFFQMQEKQSETLRGMTMNFRDSIDLMLNDIGKSQDSILKKSIKLSKEFVDYWRDFSAIITTIGYSFLAAFGAKTLMNIYKGLKNIASLAIAHPWVALASAVALVITYLYQAAEAKTKFEAAMLEVDNENIASLEESIELYHKLTETINDSTKSYEERNKALSQVKEKFNEILPDQYTELEYIKQLGGNYRDAEKAMMNYYNTKTQQHKKARIEQEYASEIEGIDIPELIKSYKDYFEGVNIIGFDESKAKIKLKAGITGVINSVVEDVKSGSINVNSIQEEINKRLELFVGDDDIAKRLIFSSKDRSSIKEDISDIISTLTRYNDAIGNIQGLPYETFEEYNASKIINTEKTNIDKATSAFKKAASLYEKYAMAIPKVNESVKQQRDNIEKDVQKILTDLPDSLIAYKDYLKDIFLQLKESADNGEFDFRSSLQTIESNLYAFHDKSGKLAGGLAKIAFDNVTLTQTANDAANEMIKNFQESLEENGKKLKLTTFQKAAIEGFEQIAKKFNVSVDAFSKFVPKTVDSLSTVRQSLKAEIDGIEIRIKEYQKSITQGMHVLSEEVLNETKKSIEDMTKLLPALKAAFVFLGGDFDSWKNRSNKLIEERIKVVDQMNKKYKELNNTLTHTESLQGAFDAYKNAFADAYGRSDVKKMSAQEFASKVLNFPNENDIVKWFDNLAKTTKNLDDKLKVELKKGEYVYDIKVRTKTDEDKSLIDSIEDMFGNYEVSLELEKLNIPPDLAKRLFGVDAIDLSTIRKEIESKLSAARASGGQEDLVEKLEEQLIKVEDLEDKSLRERLKKYSKYLTTAMGERVKIKMEELRQIEEIESMSQLSSDQKELAKKGVKKESQAKMDKLSWEEFKDSGMYVQLFEDLEYASTHSLNVMREKLEQLKGSLKNLDADDLRNLYNQIEKIDEQLAKRNPYKTLATSIDDYFRAVKSTKNLEEDLQTKQTAYDVTKGQEENLDIQLANLRAEYEAKSKNKKLTEEEKDVYLQNIDALETQLRILREFLGIREKDVKTAQENLDNNEKTKKTFKESAKEVGDYISQVANALPQLASDMENIFGTMDAGTRDTIESVSEIAGGVGSAIQGFASENYVQAIAGVIQTISGIFKIGDKKKEREIQRQIELVERLEKQYGKLEKQIDNAYKQEDLKSSFNEAQSNMNAQIAAYDKMIAQEEDKKKSDENRIKGWKEAQEEIRERQEELLHSQVEKLGGTYDYKSATREFVDAWVEAFKETGNGLKGLEDNFSDFWKNIVLNQVVMGGASEIIEPLLNEVNKALEEDFKIDGSENAAINATADEVMSLLDDFMKKAYEQYGDALTGAAEAGELTGLQRGIQGITESQADILAAYLNSIRYYVSESSNYLSQIASNYDTSIENPMLPQLKTIANQTSAINELLQSVRYNGDYGVGIRVYMP